MQAEERSGEVHGSRQHSGTQHATPATRLDKHKFPMEGDFVRDTQTLIEIEQVDATAQQNVLAVVDCLGTLRAADLVRGRTTTQERASLKQPHGVTDAAQRDDARQTSDDAT